MTEPLTTAGRSDHGAPDPVDTGLLYTIRVICQECDGPHGPLMEGEWHFCNGVVYCPACWNEERNE